MKKLIFLIIAAGLVFGAYKLVKLRTAEDEKLKGATIYPIVVSSYMPKKEHLLITLPYIATAKSDKEVIINSKFAGEVLYVKKLGEKVKKGEIVAKIDNTDLKSKEKEIKNSISSQESKLSSLKSILANLQKTHIRTKELYKVKMASIEELQNEENKINELKSQISAIKDMISSLKARLKSVKNSLKYTEIKSPINGVVSAKLINKGDNTFPAKPMLKISSNADYVLLTLPQPKSEIVYKGKIYKLTPLNSTIYGVRAYKAKIDENILNNEKITVDVVEYNGIGTALPYDAILSIGAKDYVFKLNGEPVEVKIIARGKDKAVVEGVDFPVLLAKPDLFLKIKAGHPVKVKG
ncbi:MAG: hypothetical protein GXO62_08025 [Epsilonproteobacteria bacterium]|nr:hypothetical protein [Campylobacterota bacterium]